MKELNTLEEPTVCDVCGRSMLKGERVETYVTSSGERRRVCELCRRRAEHEGWTTESAGPVGSPTTRRERGRRGGLIGRLRSTAGGQEGSGRSEPPPESFASPQADPDAEPDFGASYEGADPARSSSRPARVRDKLTRPLLRDPRHVRAVPTSPEARVQLALDLFNQSEHPRDIAGIIRSLGLPQVSAGASAKRPSEVRLTIAWELSWYQYAVDLADERDPVRVIGKGQEIADLDGPAREWNSRASEDGFLDPGLHASDPGAPE